MLAWRIRVSCIAKGHCARRVRWHVTGDVGNASRRGRGPAKLACMLRRTLRGLRESRAHIVPYAHTLAALLPHIAPRSLRHLHFYREVYKGFDKRTRTPVAIKIIDLENAEDEIDDIQQEIAILSQLDSCHVTK